MINRMIPWGLTRMEPYPNVGTEAAEFVGLDPRTQVAIYQDALGRPVEMGKHSTHKAVETGTRTNPGDGASPNTQDQDHDQRSEADQAQN
ncbi:putative ATP-grasp-modified RiPP [Streptomyces sp. NPDC047315]|uniref:putative ATP-grasp-modified RiPP n=1 Tax=Streptomyces sp. NPDC047315 TaxID=3155142 RepID=UPI0033CAB053